MPLEEPVTTTAGLSIVFMGALNHSIDSCADGLFLPGKFFVSRWKNVFVFSIAPKSGTKGRHLPKQHCYHEFTQMIDEFMGSVAEAILGCGLPPTWKSGELISLFVSSLNLIIRAFWFLDRVWRSRPLGISRCARSVSLEPACPGETELCLC